MNINLNTAPERFPPDNARNQGQQSENQPPQYSRRIPNQHTVVLDEGITAPMTEIQDAGRLSGIEEDDIRGWNEEQDQHQANERRSPRHFAPGIGGLFYDGAAAQLPSDTGNARPQTTAQESSSMAYRARTDGQGIASTLNQRNTQQPGQQNAAGTTAEQTSRSEAQRASHEAPKPAGTQVDRPSRQAMQTASQGAPQQRRDTNQLGSLFDPPTRAIHAGTSRSAPLFGPSRDLFEPPTRATYAGTSRPPPMQAEEWNGYGAPPRAGSRQKIHNASNRSREGTREANNADNYYGQDSRAQGLTVSQTQQQNEMGFTQPQLNAIQIMMNQITDRLGAEMREVRNEVRDAISNMGSRHSSPHTVD